MVRLRRRRRGGAFHQPAGDLSQADGRSAPSWRRWTSGFAWAAGWCCASARRPSEMLSRTLPLARFAPGRFRQMVPLRQTGALEIVCREADRRCRRRRRRPHDARRRGWPTCRGRSRRREADLPLVVRARARLRPGDLRGRRSRSAAVEPVGGPPAAGGQAARHAHRPRRGIGTRRGHDALRLQRPRRPVAQRAGPVSPACGWCRSGSWPG